MDTKHAVCMYMHMCVWTYRNISRNKWTLFNNGYLNGKGEIKVLVRDVYVCVGGEDFTFYSMYHFEFFKTLSIHHI